jgi:hypothetical protein
MMDGDTTRNDLPPAKRGAKAEDSVPISDDVTHYVTKPPDQLTQLSRDP